MLIGIIPLLGRLVVSWSKLTTILSKNYPTSQTGGFFMAKNMNNQSFSFRNLYAFGSKLPIDLSLSENPLGCSPKVAVVLKSLNQPDFFDYPDPDCNQLKKVLSSRFKLSADNFFVANGSEAIIKLLPSILLDPGDEVIIPKLTFPMFEIASQMTGANVLLSEMTQDLDIDLQNMVSKLSNKTKLIFLCNPNNPTGRILTKNELVNFVKKTQALVIVDEANIEFGGQSVIKEVKRLKNLVVLRTFSKGFGLAGFRIGFCAANPTLIQRLKQVSQPFPVSTIAEKAALAALKDSNFITRTRIFMKEQRTFLALELTKRGFEVIPSQANNLLVKVPVSSSNFVKALNDEDVSVVDGASFKLNGVNFIRVSPRLEITNKLFLMAIDKVMAKNNLRQAR